MTNNILLKDAPGGVDFIDSIVGAMRMLALEFAGQPDEVAIPNLDRYIARVEAGVIDALGYENAAVVLDFLRRGVLGQKQRIEAATASGLDTYLAVLRE